MRRKDLLLLLGATIIIVGAAVAVIVTSGSHSVTDGCNQTGATHTVTIQQGTAVPATTTAPRCDKLSIINKDDVTREIAFGPHEDHVPYDGVAEKVLRQDDSLTVTLIQSGTFHFHDHFHDDTEGFFTVSK